MCTYSNFFFFQAEDGIRDYKVTGVQTCALPISPRLGARELLGGGIREPPGGVAGGYAGPDLEGQLLSLELALLHLREEVAPFQVLVGRVGREGRVVLTLHLPLGLRRPGGGFPHHGGQVLLVALLHVLAPISLFLLIV